MFTTKPPVTLLFSGPFGRPETSFGAVGASPSLTPAEQNEADASAASATRAAGRRSLNVCMDWIGGREKTRFVVAEFMTLIYAPKTAIVKVGIEILGSRRTLLQQPPVVRNHLRVAHAAAAENVER